MATRLSAGEADRLRQLAFTYEGVGGTETGRIDEGFRSFTRVAPISGLAFDEVAERLMTWQLHEGAGLRVAASAPRAAPGEVVLMRLGFGAASLRIPCRVVHVVEESDRVGFAYGTLPGHPESGEEQFLVERSEEGLQFRVQAFSRPSSRLARLSGPLGRQFQLAMTKRYLHAAGASGTS